MPKLYLLKSFTIAMPLIIGVACLLLLDSTFCSEAFGQSPKPTLAVEVFPASNFKGKEVRLNSASILKNQAMMLKAGIETSVQSLRIPSGFSVTLFTGDDFTGNKQTLVGDLTTLDQFPYKIRSLKVVADFSGPIEVAQKALNDAKDMFPNHFKDKPAPSIAFNIVFRYPERLKKELARRDSESHIFGWRAFTTHVDTRSFTVVRRALRDLTFLHYTTEHLQRVAGTYIIEAVSIDGPPVVPDSPYFPTEYSITFVPPRFAGMEATRWFVPIRDNAPDVAITDAQLEAHNATLNRLAAMKSIKP